MSYRKLDVRFLMLERCSCSKHYVVYNTIEIDNVCGQLVYLFRKKMLMCVDIFKIFIIYSKGVILTWCSGPLDLVYNCSVHAFSSASSVSTMYTCPERGCAIVDLTHLPWLAF